MTTPRADLVRSAPSALGAALTSVSWLLNTTLVVWAIVLIGIQLDADRRTAWLDAMPAVQIALLAGSVALLVRMLTMRLVIGAETARVPRAIGPAIRVARRDLDAILIADRVRTILRPHIRDYGLLLDEQGRRLAVLRGLVWKRVSLEALAATWDVPLDVHHDEITRVEMLEAFPPVPVDPVG